LANTVYSVNYINNFYKNNSYKKLESFSHRTSLQTGVIFNILWATIKV